MLVGAGNALLGLGVLGLLIAIAAILEAILRRNRHRPLSRHAVTRRRWDDPALDRTRSHLLQRQDPEKPNCTSPRSPATRLQIEY